MGTSIKYYYDLMSQPCRALYILFKLNKVAVENNPIALRKGAHLTPEFKEVSRFQKVPCIVDDEFKLSESVAILHYLAGKGLISDQWYPKEAQLRARTNEYLEWQHNNTRLACTMYFQVKWLRPLITGKEPDPKKLSELKENMEKTLDLIENEWLKNGKYLTGDRVTAADIFAVCEIEQTKLAGYNAVEGRPKMKIWMESVKNATNPYHDEAHIFIEKIKNSSTSKL